MNAPRESLVRAIGVAILAIVAIVLALSFVGYVGERIAHVAMQRPAP